jgi:hypothetical protein
MAMFLGECQLRPFIASAAAMCCVCLGSAEVLGGFEESPPTNASAHGHHVVLLVHDSFGVAAHEMDSARITVNALLRLASIQTEWHTCSAPLVSPATADSQCSSPLIDNELLVRIMAAKPAVPLRSLGSAFVDPQRGPGLLATVYADRVHAVAARNRLELGLLLGRVIAHEIGHLLIGTRTHSDSGLMRSRCSDREVQRNVPFEWAWTRQDIAAIARGVAIRARHPSPATAIFAGIGTTSAMEAVRSIR